MASPHSHVKVVTAFNPVPRKQHLRLETDLNLLEGRGRGISAFMANCLPLVIIQCSNGSVCLCLLSASDVNGCKTLYVVNNVHYNVQSRRIREYWKPQSTIPNGFYKWQTLRAHKIRYTENVELNFIFCWPCISLQILVNDQLDALFHVFIYLFYLSTCFEHHHAHHQIKLY